MIAILLAGVFGGMKLDKWLQLKFPIFTVLLSLVAVTLAIYYGLKDFMHTKKK
jgi:predicted MFS family arabinose efflux permease